MNGRRKDMKQVAIAFATTGPSPKDGHRFSELVLVLVKQGTDRRLHVKVEPENGNTFAARFPEIDSFIGDASLVMLNGGRWRRFLRVELKAIKGRGARRLMLGVIDVGDWAHQRFPRQRKNVTAIASRMGISGTKELTGLEREAELLGLIAQQMNTSPAEPASVAPTKAVIDAFPAAPIPVALPETRQGNWVERVGNFWRNLTGRA
jgi:hypothetical protein